MNDEFIDKEYRDAFVEANLRNSIAFQIRALRKRHGLSQRDLGERMGEPQNVISRLEDPDYGKLTLQTLLTLASAFDVALSVRFVSFSQLSDSLVDVSDEALAVPSYEDDVAEQLREKSLSLIDEFSAPSFSNRITPTAEAHLQHATSSRASKVIDASNIFSRSQRTSRSELFANRERASGAMAAFNVANQEHRARAI